MTIKFCPKCRRPAFRLVYIPPAVILDAEMLYVMSDEEIEVISSAETIVKILSAPDWRGALICSSNSNKITFGCPWCRKGKITLLS